METENEDTTPELDLQDIVNTLFQTEPSQGKTNVINTSERFKGLIHNFVQKEMPVTSLEFDSCFPFLDVFQLLILPF